jgi:hypothetical protein
MRNLIALQNHPTKPKITRTAQVSRTVIDYDNKTVQMTVTVYSFLDGEEIKEMRKQVPLIADNSTIIDPATFKNAIADEDGNYPSSSIGEYDFLYSLITNKIKTNLELEEMYILLREDRINQKMYQL